MPMTALFNVLPRYDSLLGVIDNGLMIVQSNLSMNTYFFKA